MEKDKLIRVFFMISNKFRRLLDKKHQKLSISLSQARVINYIYRHREGKQVFQKELEEAFSIRGASATGALDGLIQLGIVNRETLETDRRKKVLSLTEKGMKLSESSTAIIEEFEMTLKNVLKEKEYVDLQNILDKINLLLDEEESINV